MKDINQVLAQKQHDRELLDREIEALKLVLAMLQDPAEANSPVPLPAKKEWP